MLRVAGHAAAIIFVSGTTFMQSDPDGRATASGGGFRPSIQPDAVRLHHRIDFGWALMPIVAAPGFSGLGYEIGWTRQLRPALGSALMAVLLAIPRCLGRLVVGR